MENRKYVYNESNQLSEAVLCDGKTTRKVQYTYDADGNLTGEYSPTDRSLTTYTYTVENRLEAVYTGTAYSRTLQMAAAYDGDGNRVYQLNYNPDKDEDLSDYYCTNNSCDYKGTGIRLQAEGEVSPAERELLSLINASGAVTDSSYELIEYINDVNREYTEVLVEQNINGTLDTAYVYGAAIGIGSDRLSLDRFDSSTGYYLYDPKGSVTGITNEEGQIYRSYRYSVFGEITFGASQYENEYTYNGESYNPNIKSQYLRARYYCVVMADFLMEDSYLGNIREPLTLNRYNYCVGNPVNYADPSGNISVVPVLAPAGVQFLYDEMQVLQDYGFSSENDFQSATEFLSEVQRFAMESTVLTTISVMSMASCLYEVERNKPTPQEMWQDAKAGMATWADGIKKDLYGFYIGALNDLAAKGETQRKIAVGTYIAHKIAWQNLEAFVDGFEQGMGDYHPTYLKYNSERADLQYSVHAGCYTANLAKSVSGVVQVVDGVLLMVHGVLNTAASPGTGPAVGLVGAVAIEEVALGYGVAAGGTWTLTQSIPAALEEVGAMFSIGINAGKNGVESAEPEGGSETNNKITTSGHAEIRGSQGRNVNTAINDLNKVKPSNVYLQDDGRYVIKGSNGRVHIMEPDGEIVTTMNNVTNFNKRVSSGRYVPLTEEQKADFAKKFSSYLNNAWSSYK